MRNLIYLLILFLSTPLYAEMRVDKISFIGDKPGTDIRLYHRRNAAFVPDSLSADSSRIVEFYRGRGWYDCQVEYKLRQKQNRVEITYQIIKNELYKLHINNNDTTVPDSLLDRSGSLISIYENQPATSRNISNLANDILRFFSAIGYPYCDVRFKNLVIENPDRLIIQPDIQPGPLVTIEKVEFDGRKNIETSFLQEYIGIVPPVGFSIDQLQAAQRRLGRAEFISDVDDFRLRYKGRPESGVIVFPIKEASPLILDGAAGYSSRDEDFYGRLNATLSNILGKGRQIRIEWAKKDKSSRWLKLALTEPYPLGIPFNLKLEVYQDDRDSTFIENGGLAGLHYLASNIYSYGISAGASRLDPESYGRTLLPHKNKLKLSVQLSVDTRDYPQNPRGGDFLFLKANFISETTEQDSLFPAANINYRTVELRLEKSIRITKSTAFYGGLSACGDFSENVPVDRLFALGGFGSLRGYMQDQFFTSRQAIVTLEYRVLTSKQGRAYIFADGALFQVPVASSDSSDTKSRAAIGIGIAASVKLGIATIEIAIPGDEGFGDAKVHFGVRAGF